MDDKDNSTIKQNSVDSKQLTQNQVGKSFLTKVSEDLWDSGDFYISGRIRERSNYGVLTSEGEFEANDEKQNPHLEVSVQDVKTRTTVPALSVEAVFKQDGEKVAGPFDLSFVYSPDETVYMGEVDIEEGCYDVLVTILNDKKDDRVEIEFENLSYS